MDEYGMKLNKDIEERRKIIDDMINAKLKLQKRGF